jgi:hypothetical protein
LIADDLLDIAQRLVEGSPNQTDLRRAISSVYYALFHAIAQSNADTLVGDDPQFRDQAAWRQAYRALDHGYANRRCQSAQNNPRFSQPIQNLAGQFVDMQSGRHRADYDPDEIFSVHDVLISITETIGYISAFRAAPERERRAFAVYVLMRERQD